VSAAASLLEVEDLRTSFATPRGLLRAVDGLSFSLGEGETLGIVGESGSGKSVTALSLLRLFGPQTHARITGRVRFDGRDLLALSDAELRRVRGAQIGMIFQDPLTSLNPAMPIGEQVIEAARYHRRLSAGESRRLAIELLELVGIPDSAQRLNDLPYRFSGGMRQRIMIAQAIACQPRLLIADEPTTALDVTVQAQILLLLARLQRERRIALIMISHDLGVIAATCDRVVVMYGGRAVEHGSVQQILERPRHPYTRALLRSVPRLSDASGRSLEAIPGQPITVIGAVEGCRFAPRCSYVIDRCRQEDPPLLNVGPEHASACWRAHELTESAPRPALEVG
jgi:oligopeptide/dipeptide ABC transporter ATP-binding protein